MLVCMCVHACYLCAGRGDPRRRGPGLQSDGGVNGGLPGSVLGLSLEQGEWSERGGGGIAPNVVGEGSGETGVRGL